MPVGTAVHDRTLALCESLNYREWSGYFAVSAYESHHEHEYNAIRNAAALIDVSPLFKYLVSGPDAARLVDRLITRDVSKMAVGQVFYTPWCDEHGCVIDDGTVSRLGEELFRWTAADPSLRWFRQNAAGLRVAVEDVSEEIAALALQGPTSARVLRAAGVDLDSLKYFRMASGTIGGVAVDVSRTGYTGDLGYEVWMPATDAVRVWDALMEHGQPFDIKPAGMLALDVARVEAGLLLIDVDFFSSKKALIEAQKYTPYEWASAGWSHSRRAGSSASRRFAPSTSAVRRGRLLASSSTGPASSRSTRSSGCRRQLAPPPRARRCRSTVAAGRSAGRPRRRGHRY